MEIKVYKSEYKSTWDNFVRESKNGTFLLNRDFIEYHGSRFSDHSLMFYSEDKLIAVMPAHIEEQIFYTHQGLTYGGLVMSAETTATDVLSIFEHLTMTLRNQGIKQIIYKAIPHIYHSIPSEEDLYALFRYHAVLIGRSISSTIFINNKLSYSKSRKQGLKKAEKNGLSISMSDDMGRFWEILNHNLEKTYNTQPVHTLEEICYLKEKFPDQISLLAAYSSDNEMVGGCLYFEMENIVHAQYTAATADGKNMGAVDVLVDHIVNEVCANRTYFDYGTSTENGGLYLNETLIYQKEGFGARATVYDVYTITL